MQKKFEAEELRNLLFGYNNYLYTASFFYNYPEVYFAFQNAYFPTFGLVFNYLYQVPEIWRKSVPPQFILLLNKSPKIPPNLFNKRKLKQLQLNTITQALIKQEKKLPTNLKVSKALKIFKKLSKNQLLFILKKV